MHLTTHNENRCIHILEYHKGYLNGLNSNFYLTFTCFPRFARRNKYKGGERNSVSLHGATTFSLKVKMSNDSWSDISWGVVYLEMRLYEREQTDKHLYSTFEATEIVI
jgi:hypothetical protein